ncbi:MAG TPA: DUF1045 domain-containing protein [Patescibacteria group bacterium]|nr:DUF1045 domain-containing protein [Patescibacteria group bacterium]
MQFALYLIPDEGKLYNLGSTCVGYDIRNSKVISGKKLGNMPISDSWQIETKLYGFHLTITDLVTISNEKIIKIVNCIAKILKALDFNSIEMGNGEISFMPNNQKVLSLIYKNNYKLLILHTLLVSYVQSMGENSLYLEKLLNNRSKQEFSASDIAKIRLFLSPYVFDKFLPHMTLLNPVSEKDRETIANNAREIICTFPNQLNIQKISLVLRNDENSPLCIYKEFKLGI